MKKLITASLALATATVSWASDTDLEQQLKDQQQQLNKLTEEIRALRGNTASIQEPSARNWQFVSYGSMLYKRFERFDNVQDTDPTQRAKADIERIVTEFKYRPSQHWTIEVEIEYEHGGTGSTMEYDGFEEFGEFETETEAGGEVVIEKAQFEYEPSDSFGIKFGRIHIPLGLGTVKHAPFSYFTAERHWSEAMLIPQVWHETGINFNGSLGDFHYQALLTTGLNSEYFRTTDWVAGGHQTRFESVNADSLATTLELSYGSLRKDHGIALAWYQGDPSDNRHKEDKISESGNVSIISVKGAATLGDLVVRGEYISGSLDDSAAIANANKNTAGLDAGSFTQVGSEAEAMFIEAGYNISPLLGLQQKIQPFIAWEHANPLKDVESGSASKRYDQTETSIGVNYYPVEKIVLKSQISNMTTEQSDIPDTTNFSLSAGYLFAL